MLFSLFLLLFLFGRSGSICLSILWFPDGNWLGTFTPVVRCQGSTLAPRWGRSRRRSGNGTGNGGKLAVTRFDISVAFPENQNLFHIEAALRTEISKEELLVHDLGGSFDLNYTSYVLSVGAGRNLDLVPNHVHRETTKNAARIRNSTAPADGRVIASRKTIVKSLYTR